MSKKTIFLTISIYVILGIILPFASVGQSTEKGPIKKFKWLAEKPSGLYNVTTFSLDFFKSPVINGAHTILGYKFNPHIAIGGGIGYERYVEMDTYNVYSANFTLMPVYSEVRYTMFDKKFSPVLAMQAGYKYMINRSSSQIDSWRVSAMGSSYTDYEEYDYYDQGGMSFTVEGGIKMKLYHRMGLYIGVSYSAWTVSGQHYKWMFTHLEVLGGNVVEKTSRTITPTEAYHNMLLVRLGFTL